MSNIQLGIRRLPETGEYKLTWKQDGKFRETFSYYTDSEPDVIATLMSETYSLRKAGNKVSVSKTALDLMQKWHRKTFGY